MSSDNLIVLVSPIHDPDGRLAGGIINNGKKLTEIFDNCVFVSVTTNTSQKTISELKNANTNCFFLPKEAGNALGNNYRNAIRLGIKNNPSQILLLDFDRALHWARRFPKELEKVKKDLINFPGFTSFVRSKRAFESHPLTQRSTETTVNAIASEVAGMDLDIMSGAFGMDGSFAKLILEKSQREDFGFYAEVLEIALKNNLKINRLEVEGLEWETPDQYRDKIEKEGYSQWLSEFESLPEWEKRVKLLEKSTEVLTEKK